MQEKRTGGGKKAPLSKAFPWGREAKEKAKRLGFFRRVPMQLCRSGWQFDQREN